VICLVLCVLFCNVFCKWDLYMYEIDILSNGGIGTAMFSFGVFMASQS